MPSRSIHERFDRFLANKGVLMADGKYGVVHEFMDRGVKFYGSKHRESDPYHGTVTRAKTKWLRKWLNGKYNTIGQDRATDWLRAGYGHICLDEFDSRLWKNYTWDSVFDSAYRSMAKRRWTKAHFVPT